MDDQEFAIDATNNTPMAIDDEEALLGCLIGNPDALLELDQQIDASDFYVFRHRWVWEAIKELDSKRLPIDIMTVGSELDRMGKLKDTGGRGWLISLTQAAPSFLNVAGYAASVKECAVRRRLLSASSKIAAVAHEGFKDLPDVIGEAQAALMDAIGTDSETKIYNMRDVVSASYDATMVAVRGGGRKGYTTGLASLDRKSRGLKAGELILIAARPGMGKTSWLLQAALANAEAGIEVGFVSYEMGREALVGRALAANSDLSFTQVDEGVIPDTESAHASYLGAVEGLSELPVVFLDDAGSATPQSLRMNARLMVFKHNIKILFVDYLQLMHVPGFRGGDNRTQEIGQISRQLKLLARELEIPVVAASQLSRAVESRSDKRPMLSDLRESGSLEQDADKVLFLFRETYYENASAGGPVEINVSKHRNGSTGIVQAYWHPEKMRFTELQREHIELDDRKVSGRDY